MQNKVTLVAMGFLLVAAMFVVATQVYHYERELLERKEYVIELQLQIAEIERETAHERVLLKKLFLNEFECKMEKDQ